MLKNTINHLIKKGATRKNQYGVDEGCLDLIKTCKDSLFQWQCSIYQKSIKNWIANIFSSKLMNTLVCVYVRTISMVNNMYCYLEYSAVCMSYLDALLADLEVSLPLSHLNCVPNQASGSRLMADCQSRNTDQQLVSARRVSCFI